MISGVALFVISGVSAAGKSTVARLLAGRFERGVCVPGDAVHTMVVSGRLDMRPGSGEGALRQLVLRYAGALAVASVYLRDRFDVVVEDVIIGPVLRDFLELVPVPEFHLVFLDPDAAAIERRERDRDGTTYGASRRSRPSSPSWTPAASTCPCPADRSQGEQGEQAAVRQHGRSLEPHGYALEVRQTGTPLVSRA